MPVDAGVAEATGGASPSIPTGAEGGASQSDEQILGIQEPGADLVPAEEVSPPPVEEQPKPDADKPPEEEAIPADATPEWLKPALADKVNGPKIQSLFNQYQNFASQGTPAEFKAFKEQFPGGVADAQAFVEKAGALDDADDRFSSGDPEKQTTLSLEWQQDNPEAFSSMVEVGMGVLAARDPQGYGRLESAVLGEALKGLNLDSQFAALKTAEQSGDAERYGTALLTVVNALREFADSKGLVKGDRRPNPEAEQLARDRESLSKQQQSFEGERYKNFASGIETQVRTDVMKSIEGTLAQALKNTAFGTPAKQRMAKEIAAEVNRIMGSDKGITRQWWAMVRPGNRAFRLDDQTRQQAQKLMLDRAKRLVPEVTKKVVEGYTGDFIRTQDDKNKRQEAAASRRDIAGGTSTPSASRLTPEKARKMSDEEILNY